MGLIRRFWGLSRPDRWLALEAATAVTLTRIGLQIAGYRVSTSLIHQLTPNERISEPNVQPVERIAAMLNATTHHLPFQATCLERSLALWMMLKRRGCDAELRIGARKSGGHFEAHAWIEHTGMVLNDASGEYLSFYHFENPLPDQDLETR